MRNVLISFSVFTLLLAACTPGFDPEEVDFENDPRILRGEWVGEATNFGLKPLVYSPDGAALFTVEGYEATVRDAQSLEITARLELDEGEFIDAAQFNLNGETLATTRRDTLFLEDDAYISLWNAQTGQRLQEVSFKGEFKGFSADLERFAVISFQAQTTVDIWTFAGERLISFALPQNFEEVTVSPDLATVAVLERVEATYVAKVWNMSDQTKLLEYPIGSQNRFDTFQFSADASLLVIASGESNLNVVRVWSIATGKFSSDAAEIVGDILTFSGKKFVTRPSCNNCFYIWDAETITKLAEVDIDLGFVSSPVFDAQLSQFAAHGPEDQLFVSDLTSGSILAQVPAAEPLDFRLDLEATYGSKESYNVSGTLQFGNELYNIQGKVEGAGEEVYLKPASSPPEAYFNLEALDANSEIDWLLSGPAPDNRTYGDSPSLDDVSLEGDIQRPAPQSPSRSFRLERQP